MMLYLARHAESIGDDKGIFQGKLDFSLSEKGEKQAERLGQKLKHIYFSAFYTSDIERARQTAQIIYQQFDQAYAPEPPMLNERLREWDMGTLEGKYVQNHQIAFQDVFDHPTKSSIQGETIYQLIVRVTNFVSDLYKMHQNKNVLCISHTRFIIELICFSLGLKMKKEVEFSVDNASLHLFQIMSQDNMKFKAKLITLNDISHLC